jgi:hypothetical protein
MKHYLALLVALAGSAVLAQGRPAPVQQVAAASVAQQALSAPVPAPAPTAGLRRLSVDERAELRRQLYQFNRLAGKAQ